MGAFNEVVDAVVMKCPACGELVSRPIQYRFGDTWQYRYRLGDLIKWGGNDVGEPGHAVVIADGYGDACPNCRADQWAEHIYEVRFERDVIHSVHPASGRYIFSGAHPDFLVVVN